MPQSHATLIGREVNQMSDMPKGKIFGVEVSPEDITLGTDGSIIIRNSDLSKLVNLAQLKIARELLQDPSRALPPIEHPSNPVCI
jgi:hypothetical protein